VKFDFLNTQGEPLSGSLEMPAEGAPKAFALFAHCFTCSKDLIAANVVSKKLTRSQIGVLRFDFTSSNVQDLISAYNSLSEKFQAPQLLIGHSLGGAAVLKAAGFLKDIRAVVTIGAPSSTKHVTHMFDEEIKQIEREGQAKVKLAGRDFTIKKQFIDDVKNIEVLDSVKALKKAILVMHAPTDQTVSIDHAANIFKAAKHPKSFISLDSADHLLSKRSDATYVADIIGAWVDRYICTK